jgi:uncharacterized protein (DUF2235 family)
MAGRNLVLCLDGTSNRYKRDNTNVVKLFAMLDRSREDQLVYYQPGIGTLTPIGVYNRLLRGVLRVLDLAFAILLKQHVLGAYQFLMNQYRPGDRIYAFGFSRGAYTARVLAGMLYKVGLLPPQNSELVEFAWDLYKRARKRADDCDRVNGFRETFSVLERDQPVELLGLWDTVSSVRYLWKDALYDNTRTNPGVANVAHAIALEERRAYFQQNRWTTVATATQLTEVWFPGVHCDVGGGYVWRESGLANVTLRWMVDHAARLHAPVHFDAHTVARYLPQTDTAHCVAPNPDASAHESLASWWWLAELIPRRHAFECPPGTWTKRWIIPLGRYRTVAPDAKVTRTVLGRPAAGQPVRVLPDTVLYV